MSLNKDILEQPRNLIYRCIAGDRQSQSLLYELFAPKMFVVCLRYSGNREEAEEILQEGFLKVFEHVHQFRFTGSFEGWIRTIMVHSALQYFRSKRQLHPTINIETANIEHSYAEDITVRLETKELITTIQQLPAAYRLVFNLYVFEGMTHKEISQHLGISEGTSKSNLFDARRILRQQLQRKSYPAHQTCQSL